MRTKITHGRENSLGMDIMRRINEGSLRSTPIEYVEAVKAKVIENCTELIEHGARIRPLMRDDGVQVGWCRGVHVGERAKLKHWITDPNDYILNILMLGTSFSKEELEAMSGYEIRSLTEVVQQMSAYDNSLMPYLPAYSTSYRSENLWFSKGEQLASWEEHTVNMPDGKVIRITAPSDHAKGWVSLCTYREQSKRRLEQDFNALFIVRPWAGRHADPIQAELQRVARGLETDSSEPWVQIVRMERKTDVNDGWGHPGDSLEDLQRELKGMMEGDKHEKVMEAWQKQIAAEEEQRKKKLAELRAKRGTDREGIVSERIEILTDAQVKARQKALLEGKAPKAAIRREDYEVAASDRQLDKIKRYR